LTTTFEVDGITYKRPELAADRAHGNPMFKIKEDAPNCDESCTCGFSEPLMYERKQWTEEQIDTWVHTGRSPWW